MKYHEKTDDTTRPLDAEVMVSDERLTAEEPSGESEGYVSQYQDTEDTFGDMSLPLMRESRADLTAQTDSLSAYMTRLNYIEPLPAEKQQELAERYVENQDEAAGKMLVLTNLRLVVKLAREYQRRWANLLDLIQEGNLGLSEALQRYDPYRGVKFTSYAQYWIRAMILNYLMNKLHTVKVGSSRAGRKLFFNLKKARRTLQRQGLRNPTPGQIAEYLEVDEKEVVRVANQLDAPPVHLDAPAPGYESTTVGELMESDAISPHEAVAENDFIAKVKALMQEFGAQIEKDRRKAIWQERMISDDPKTLVELGEEWGVSKERIRQVEVQIREDFRIFLVGRMGESVKVNFLDSFL